MSTKVKQGWPAAPALRCTGPMKAATTKKKTGAGSRVTKVVMGAAVLLWAGLASAQLSLSGVRLDPYDYEQVTVSTSAVGLTAAKVTPTTGHPAEYVELTVEDNDVRCTVDGTTPTATVGHLVKKDTRLALVDHAVIAALRCIRVSADAKVSVTFYRRTP